jgi:hypothetical protein
LTWNLKLWLFLAVHVTRGNQGLRRSPSAGKGPWLARLVITMVTMATYM